MTPDTTPREEWNVCVNFRAICQALEYLEEGVTALGGKEGMKEREKKL